MGHEHSGTFPHDANDPLLRGFLPGAHVHLQLLGEFRLLIKGSPVELTHSAERLVALLALSGRGSRSRIAGTLWPDVGEPTALACLRTAVWRIKGRVGGVVEAQRATVALQERVVVDVTSGDRHPDGELLPEWDDDWLVAERERRHQERLHVLDDQARRLSQTGSFGEALRVAFAALSADPLRESAHRTVIAIHLAEGNISEALRAYDRCRHMLLRELGVSPSEATAAMLRGSAAGSGGSVTRRSRLPGVAPPGP